MEIENIQSKKAYDPLARHDTAPDPDERPENPLDSEASNRKHLRLLEWMTQERERQSINRYQMALDEDYYDHLQWAEEDAQVLRERGQAPLVFNIIKESVDWVLGTEKRTRIDSKVLPREEDDVKGAETKTKLLKYLSDTNKTTFARSHAFEDAVKAGLGWLEDGIRADTTDEPLYSRYENWRYMLYDSNSIERDLSDARYLFRTKWVDLDIAEAYFPERKEQLRQAAISSDLGEEEQEDFWYLGQHFQERDASGATLNRRTFVTDALVNNRRARVKLIECWYREPTKEKVVRGGRFNGQSHDPKNQEMATTVAAGAASLFDRITLKVRVAIMTEGHLIMDEVSPYRHNRFPFTPIWAYRRKRDNAPYGMIRGMRDPQDDYNKRASKALFMLSVNRVITDDDAVEDHDEAREEAARPDMYIKKKVGREFKVENNALLAEEHLKLMDRDLMMVRRAGGVTDQNLGVDNKGLSGKAIGKLQEQGSIVTSSMFDNYRYAMQLEGEIQLSLIEQFYAAPKVVRLVGERGGLEWLKVNQYDAANDSFTNDITKTQADFIIGEQDYRQSLRQAMFETLTDMVGKMDPELALKFLDLVFEMSDIPGKEEWVARIRQINGFTDPSKEPTPEEQQQQQALQQAKQAEQAMQQQAAQLQFDEQKAKINEANAKAEKLRADINNLSGQDEQRNALEGRLQDIQQKAQDQLRAFQDKISMLTQDLHNKEVEINRKHDTEVEREKIKADGAVRVAEANKANEEVVSGLSKTLETLTQEVADLKTTIEDQQKADKEEKAKPAPEPEKTEPPAPNTTVINLSVDGKVKKTVKIGDVKRSGGRKKR